MVVVDNIHLIECRDDTHQKGITGTFLRRRCLRDRIHICFGAGFLFAKLFFDIIQSEMKGLMLD